MSDLGFTTMVPDPSEYSAFWQETEARVKPLLELAKREAEKK
jgi:hypothetical protein